MPEKTALAFELYTNKYKEECCEILCDAFTRRQEPMANHISYESGAFQFFCDYYLDQADKDKMSTVCVEKERESVVGVILTLDLCFAEDPLFLKTLEDHWGDWFPQVFFAVEQVEKPLLRELVLKDKLRSGRVWHMWMLGVASEWCHQGVGLKLAAENMKLARERGFEYAVADCTNTYSRNICEKMGFRLFNELKYSEYEFPLSSGKFPMRDKCTEKDFDALYLMIRDVQPKGARCSL